MQGFYAMYYTGISGVGHAVFVLNDGKITGADSTGGILDGNYQVDGERVKIEVTLSVPGGTTLVTGQTLADTLSQTICAELATSFADGQPVLIQTPMGPVNVIFKKLRGLG